MRKNTGEDKAKQSQTYWRRGEVTAIQHAELRKKLSLMSVTAVMDAYRSAYFPMQTGRRQNPLRACYPDPCAAEGIVEAAMMQGPWIACRRPR